MARQQYPPEFYTKVDEYYNKGQRGWAIIGRKVLADMGLDMLGDSTGLSDIVRLRCTRTGMPGTRGYTRAERLKGEHPYLAEQSENLGLPIDRVDRYWTKTDEVSVLTVIPKDPVIIGYEEIKRQILELTANHAPAYPYINRLPIKDKHLFIADPADPHFGKYANAAESGEPYNLKIAESRFAEGIDGLIQKAVPYSPERVIYVGGNDILHVDGPTNTTTGGTRQDTAALWHESYLSALMANVAAIDRLLELAPVHVAFCPSNHDFQGGYMLFQNIRSWYRQNRDVTFDATIAPRKYVQYGSSLVGFAHGDGANEKDLSDLMKSDAKAAWSQSKYAYWILHHRHHKDKKAKKGTLNIQMEKDHIGVTVFHTGYNLEPEDYCHVEYVRSISGPDAWHAKSGFTHALKCMDGFIFDPYGGQVAKIHHLF